MYNHVPGKCIFSYSFHEWLFCSGLNLPKPGMEFLTLNLCQPCVCRVQGVSYATPIPGTITTVKTAWIWTCKRLWWVLRILKYRSDIVFVFFCYFFCRTSTRLSPTLWWSGFTVVPSKREEAFSIRVTSWLQEMLLWWLLTTDWEYSVITYLLYMYMFS